MAKTLDQLMATHRWVYYLDETSPDPDNPKRFRVSIVFENEQGHFPTGQGDTAPWYWDVETCEAKNAKRGFNKEEAFKIVTSSMFPAPAATK